MQAPEGHDTKDRINGEHGQSVYFPHAQQLRIENAGQKAVKRIGKNRSSPPAVGLGMSQNQPLVKTDIQVKMVTGKTASWPPRIKSIPFAD